MKVVINADFGGFSLSKEACRELGLSWNDYGFVEDIKRDDPQLVSVVERLGKRANGTTASLKVVEIPDDVEWEIDEYDGSESVHEKHRSWS